MERINLYSYAGGVGLTTTAAAMAVSASHWGPVHLVGDHKQASELCIVFATPPMAADEPRCQVGDRITIHNGPAEDTYDFGDGTYIHVRKWAQRGYTNLLVTKLCYMAIRAATLNEDTPNKPDGIIVVTEPGRALSVRDAELAIGAPCVAEIPWDPAVHRSVDAGLVSVRLPKSIMVPMSKIINTKEVTV